MGTPTKHRYTIVVDRSPDWKWNPEGFHILTADDYLAQPLVQTKSSGPGRIINLCRDYHYLSGGYYCSLLAEARRQLPMPTMADILDLSGRKLYAFALPELEASLTRILKRLADPPTQDFSLYVFFGHADDPRFRALGDELFDIFRFPLIKVRIRRKTKRWAITSIRPLGLHQVHTAQRAFFETTLRAYTRAPARRKANRVPELYNLAILYDPHENLPPSNPKGLERFARVARTLRMEVELITRKDYHRIPEFDALFIRETTGLNHHTFQFARKAELEGLPVIDDTSSIIRCANKIFLFELLASHGLPTPKSISLDRLCFNPQRIAAMEEWLGYPMVLKVPDGSFSRGIHKANNRAELEEHAARLFIESRLILAQEYMYTAFDWRIGILNGRPLYASQYHMSRNHWQIYRHQPDGTVTGGGFRTMAVEEAPADVVETARRAAILVGTGLYGVDLKQNGRGVHVIEVNDNPNIDHGVEDKAIKDLLYTRILREFIDRIEAGRRG
ncbi:MAG: RimK family protein [Magnetococcales bacterium]|nr:RimK family protein [Magnetococcales bacterium]